MALADYYQRGVVAAAQVLAGFDEQNFRETLTGVTVGLSFGADALTVEGNALTDLATRITARLYPSLAIRPGPGAEARATELRALALAINPAIEITDAPTIEVAVGLNVPQPLAPTVIYAGCTGWDARISCSTPQAVGATRVPFGAGASASIAAANLFRAAFLTGADARLDEELVFSAFTGSCAATPPGAPERAELDRSVVLAGCGGIGNAAVWALARANLSGTIDLVDGETLDLGNMQRYVLSVRSDEGRPKVEIAADTLTGPVHPVLHQVTLAEFLATRGHDQDRVLLALDSARDRRQAQASLPRWIANAWTQPGDLGVSVHRFGAGACVSCLYLPEGALPNEDQLVADALRVPERLMEIRVLLHTGGGVPRALLDAVAAKLGRPIEPLLPFEGRPLRAFYVEGMCGGAVIPLGQNGAPAQDVHVPLAHQSALAGVLLAAALMRDAAHAGSTTTMVTRINLMEPIGEELTRPAQADARALCICRDEDYRHVYALKYDATVAALPIGETAMPA